MKALNVTLPVTWFEIAESLKTATERGQFYHGIFRYAFLGVEPRFAGSLKTYFSLIKPLLDRKLSQNKRAARHRSKGVTGNVTGNAGKDVTKDVAKGVTKDLAPAASPARAVDDTRASINNNSQEREKNKEKEKEVTFAGLLPLHLQTPSFLAKWQEWERFRRLKRKPISRMAAVRQIKMLSEFDPLMAAQAIDNSIQNDYQGLFPPSRGAAVRNIEQPKRKDYTGV